MSTSEPDSPPLEVRFQTALADSRRLSERPAPETLLKMYALYKQATSGDVSGARPAMTDFVGRAKWDAWAELKGRTAAVAKAEYIALVDLLR